MPRIFDNIEQDLPGGLRATLAVTKRADFCVDYLNLRGWQDVDDLVHPWSVANGQICRVLAGMQRPPLTLQGLARQGELNLDLLDHHAAQRLSTCFDQRWSDRWALDVSADLAALIEASWAREAAIPPFHIYLNIAYHMSTEARAGLSGWRQLPWPACPCRAHSKKSRPKAALFWIATELRPRSSIRSRRWSWRSGS